MIAAKCLLCVLQLIAFSNSKSINSSHLIDWNEKRVYLARKTKTRFNKKKKLMKNVYIVTLSDDFINTLQMQDLLDYLDYETDPYEKGRNYTYRKETNYQKIREGLDSRNSYIAGFEDGKESSTSPVVLGLSLTAFSLILVFFITRCYIAYKNNLSATEALNRRFRCNNNERDEGIWRSDSFAVLPVERRLSFIDQDSDAEDTNVLSRGVPRVFILANLSTSTDLNVEHLREDETFTLPPKYEDCVTNWLPTYEEALTLCKHMPSTGS